MNRLCVSCGAVGEPRTETRGSFLVELALWLLFCAPGLIYSLWRLTSRQRVCRTCGSVEIIPLDSPRAKAMMGTGGET